MKHEHWSVLLEAIANILLNIASAWFGVILIAPTFALPLASIDNAWILTKGLLFGMLYLVVAYQFQLKAKHL